jgi:hypothetical protein
VKRDVGLRGEGKKKERVEKVGTHTSFSREQKNKKNRADEQIVSRRVRLVRSDEQIRRADQIRKSFRALARTLQTRGLDILLRALTEGRTERHFY